MYKNQYYITNTELSALHELKKISFNNLYVYFHPSLNVSISKKQSVEILMLGYIIDPFNPKETNDNIVQNLAETCVTKESLFKEIQQLSGRFVLIYKSDSDFIALNDACALKQLYYGFLGDNVILTSSPRMFLDFFGGELEVSGIKRDFINLKEYNLNDHIWFGDKCIDNRLLKVLPNHFLDIFSERVHRTPICFDDLVKESDIVEYAAALLKGSMAAITRRYQVVQPLTAGWDSRTLLAASKDYLEDIEFYVIDLSSDDNLLPDVWVPQSLSKKLGLNFQVIRLEDPSDEFITIFNREQVVPRFSYIAELEYLYHYCLNRNTVRVNGIAGATPKSVYGYTKFVINTNKLHYFTGYSGKSEFVKDEINCWANGATQYSKKYDIPLLDLFHWEQKVGNWGALTLFEQDIATENFCPHGNRNLLVSLLRINPERRAKPECFLIRDITKYLWEETLSEPVNPVGFIKGLRRKFKKNALLKNFHLRIQSALYHSKKR